MWKLSFALLFALPAFAQPGVERVTLQPDSPRHVVVTGSTAWITVSTAPQQLYRVDGNSVTTVTLAAPVAPPTRDLAATPGFLWILTNNAVVRHEIATGTSAVMQTLSFSPFDRIVVAADGNLWFSRENQLYRMTTAGTILGQFTLPFLVTELAATGSAVWAVGGSQQFLGASTTVVRFSIDGARQTFTLPGAVGLAAPGLSNDVWLSGGTSLFHLADSGNVLSAFLVPRHHAMATAPDGDVWLTGWLDNPFIHRIRNGIRTTYLVPFPPACNGGPERMDITIGSDGRPRILEIVPSFMSVPVPIPCQGTPPPPPPSHALVTLDPAQLVIHETVNLDPLAAIPLASPLGLAALVVGMAIAAVVVMRR